MMTPLRGWRVQRLDRLQLAPLRVLAPVVRATGGAGAPAPRRHLHHRQEGLGITHLSGNHSYTTFGTYLSGGKGVPISTDQDFVF